MTAIIINGKELAELWKVKIEDYIRENKFCPSIAVILIGNDPASQVYVRNKRLSCEKIGINFRLYHYNENVSEYSVLSLIEELNQAKDINAILVQMPIPKHINPFKVIEAINPCKDVDGFHPYNTGCLVAGNPYLAPCTPMAVVRLIKHAMGDEKLAGKNVTVIGRSLIVGKPVSAMLTNLDATVTIAHSKTVNLKEVSKRADILVLATGKACMITKDYVKEGGIVIDVGITRGDDGKLKGDVDFDDVKDIAGAITPVPGGVGPMTIAMILYNVVKSYALFNGKKFEI